MIESFYNFAFSFTPDDFKNWMVGIGTIAIGLGTIGLAYAALKTIPEKIGARYKDKDIITLYQKVVYRMYSDVAASTEGICFSLPKDVEQLTKLLLELSTNR